MIRPRVAIIGGGIFGVSCALELASFCDVTIYEAREDIMMGGTYGNQYRHHFGYHYPRSKETVVQCLDAEKDFLGQWEGALLRTMPSYYAVAKEGSKVSASAYIQFCTDMGLPHERAYPSHEWLNQNAVDICIRTEEPVYGYERLKRMAKEKLAQNGVRLQIGAEIAGARFGKSDEKIFTVQGKGSMREEMVDYAVNALYANYNLFRAWLGFPVLPLEFRLKELAVIRLSERDRCAVTVMDGPFVTVVPMEEDDLYTLGDVVRSVHEVRHSTGGIPWTSKYMQSRASRFAEMKAGDSFYIPCVANAEYVKSIFTVLPILPRSAETDARPTAVTSHGRGCWSVFEGKIITCVRAAKEIAAEIFNDCEV